MVVGWRRESFRHSLAARGIKTNKYMASKAESRAAKTALLNFGGRDNTPSREVVESELSGESVLGKMKDRVKDVISRAGGPRTKTGQAGAARLVGGELLGRVATDVVVSQRDIEVALDNLDKGRPAKALMMLAREKEDKLSPSNAEQLRTSLGSYAISRAQAGQPIPEGVMKQLDRNFKTSVAATEKEFAQAGVEPPVESQLRKQLGETGRTLTAETIDALPSLLGEIGREGLTAEKTFTGVSGNIDNLEKTPMFDPVNEQGGANAFIDDKGKFGDFEVPRSSDAFNFEPLASGGQTNVALKDDPGNLVGGVSNVAMGESFDGGVNVKTPAENISERVDSLSKSKAKLAEVDLSAFEVGNTAFEKGDREELIRSISELQSQEGKLKDRWDLVSQTHMQVKSTNNHDTSFQKSKGGVFSAFGGSSGADRLVDQTEKLSDVRGEIMKSNNEAFGRRRMLEFRLQRLDAQVPPETWAPNKITRFGDRDNDSLGGIFDKAAGW